MKNVFSRKKNIVKFSDGRTYVNCNEGLDAAGFSKWVPDAEKFVVINTNDTNGYSVKRIKSVNIIKNEVTLYDNTSLKFSEISPFVGEFI